MTVHWKQAAQSYRVADPSARRDEEAEIAQGAAALEEFMRTLGGSARELLAASKRHIIFGEEREGSFAQVYVITGAGLQMSTEAAGMWTVCSKDVPKPKLSPITPRQAIEAAVRLGGKKASEVVDWLHKQLDEIANAAPKTAK